MGQIYKMYEFETDLDLRYKAVEFKNLLDQMAILGVGMTMLIKDELKDSSGKLIEEINHTILENQKKNEAMISEQLSAMDTMALQYSNYINDMNKQYITISYEEKEVMT
jgi:hypothetical protein